MTQVWRTSKWPPKLNKDLKWRLPRPQPNLKMEVWRPPRKMRRTLAKNRFGFYPQKRSKLKEEKKAKRNRTKPNNDFLNARTRASTDKQTKQKQQKKSNLFFLRLHAVHDKTACYFSFLMAFLYLVTSSIQTLKKSWWKNITSHCISNNPVLLLLYALYTINTVFLTRFIYFFHQYW